MSNCCLTSGRPGPQPHYRLRRILVEAASAALGAIIVIWSLIPVYNMFLVALDPVGHNEFTGEIWPPHPTVGPFVALWTEGVDDVEHIWQPVRQQHLSSALW